MCCELLTVRDDRGDFRLCEGCGTMKWCRNLKAAHVPIYSWRCGRCANEWCAE